MSAITGWPKKKSDRVIERRLPVFNGSNYVVTVRTGHRDTFSFQGGAGTDAEVFVNIKGDGETGKIFLSHSINHTDSFEADKTDIFHIKGPYVSNINEVVIGFDDSNDDWLCESVTVEDMTGTEKKFICGEWLKMKNNANIKTLKLGGGAPTKVPMYLISVKTGNDGTNGNIRVTLIGTKGRTEPFLLEKSIAGTLNLFKKNTVDEFEFPIAEDIGEIVSATVNIKNGGLGALGNIFEDLDWMLDSLTVTTPTQTFSHPVNFKLTKKKDTVNVPTVTDTISRSVSLSNDIYENAMDKTDYSIIIETGTENGAGTDANVWMEFQGVSGEVGRLNLEKSLTHKDKFENGHLDEFSFPNLLDVGKIVKVTIGFDNKGLGSDWLLESVTINSRTSKFYFFAHEWLNKKQMKVDLTMRTVTLTKTDAGFGFSIAGDKVSPKPVYISKLAKGGLADRSTELHVGDRICDINGYDLHEATQSTASQCVKNADDTLVLKVQADEPGWRLLSNARSSVSSRSGND